MKIRRVPEDFEVEEKSDVVPEAEGEFALYRLTKRGLGTLEAVSAVARAWRIPPRAISYGGLKDRHAVTRQFATILRGPRRDLKDRSITLEYLGQVARAFRPSDIRGNRFRIVIRDLNPDEERRALAAVEEVRLDGLPNYFDDQRFGSLGYGGVHVAEPWIRRDYEGTLRLGLAEATPMDRPRDREAKRLMREKWGDWRTLAARLPPSPRRSVAAHLAARPGDFLGALRLVSPDLRSLWLSAFQGHLYNLILGAWIRERVPADRVVDVEMKAGTLPFFRALPKDLRATLHALVLPLPSSRIRLPEGDVKDLVERTLSGVGLTLREVNVKDPRGSFFSKGERAAAVLPGSLEVEQARDDLHPGRTLLALAFHLPRGSYATILVKRMTVAAG